MRWDGLFTDLEAELAALNTSERAAEVEERRRIEVSRLQLVDRLWPAVGTQIALRCAGGLSLTGVLRRVGSEWALLDEGGGRESVVAVSGLLSVSGLSRLSEAPGTRGTVESRLGLRHVLRGVARDRSPAQIYFGDGQVASGTLDRVGADFVEIAGHAPGEWRRQSDVRDVLVVRLDAIVAVRRSP